jgi:hypothetical protein
MRLCERQYTLFSAPRRAKCSKIAKTKNDCRSISRKKPRTSLPIEWVVLRKIVDDKNILLKTPWIKGHAGITGNELSNFAANATSSALQLSII